MADVTVDHSGGSKPWMSASTKMHAHLLLSLFLGTCLVSRATSCCALRVPRSSELPPRSSSDSWQCRNTLAAAPRVTMSIVE
jgi:hypothetical protein